jgi:Fusaric acid resistance protein-like
LNPTILQDRIVAADPALVRFFMAARATAAVGTALALLLFLRSIFHMQLSEVLVGVPLGMMAINAVNDSRHRDQRITTLLLWLPAAASILIGTFAAPNRILSEALFVIVLFVAIYVRRYGPRGSAMGVILVISFFFVLVFHIAPRELPWALLSVLITLLTTYLFRFVLLRDNPRLALRNASAAFRARQRLLAAASGPARERHALRLNETALVLHDLLRDPEDRLNVLETEVASVSQERSDPLHLDENAPVDSEWTPRAPFRVGTQIDTGRIHQTLRQAIQLSAAGTLAIMLGEVISSQRWYWAVLTAFIVFIGTSSSGEIRSRAWSRVAGTAFGVVAGMLLSYAVLAHKDLAFAVLMTCLFATVYTLRLSFAWFTFFLTIVISMLYLLLGLFSDGLLALRLTETVLGALLGGAAATLLLPISTRRVSLNVTVEALKRLDDLVGSSVESLRGNRQADPIDAARRFDEALQSTPDNRYFSLRMTFMMSCAYYARALASLAYQRPQGCNIQALSDLRETIGADIRAIVASNDDSALAPAMPPVNRVNVEGNAASYLRRIDRALRGLSYTLTVEV